MPRLRPVAALAGALTLASALQAHAAVDAKLAPDQVTITDDGKTVLVYRARTQDPSQPGRSNYVHPLYAPDGTLLTEDRGADFPEQRGAFWAWRQVRLNGQLVADGWGMSGLTYFVKETKFQGQVDGSGVLTLDTDWIVSTGGELVYVARETTAITVYALNKGARRIAFDTTITPRVDGLSLGGSEDSKGYGGFALRLVRPDKLTFAAQGKVVSPAQDQIAGGPAMGFSWANEAGLPAWALGLACKAQGKPITQWILRNTPSMQNCAFPGRAPFTLTKDTPLHLESTLVIQPRSPAK